MQPRAAQQLSVVQAVPCASIGFGPWGGAGCPRGRRGTVWCPLNPPPPPPKDGWYRLCRCTVCNVGSPEAPPCLQGNAVLRHAGASPGGWHHPWALLHAQGRRWGKANPPVRLHRAPRPAGGGGWGWGEQGQQAVGRAGCAQCNQSLHPGWRMKKRRRTMDGNRGGSGVREAPNGGGGGLTSGL